MSNRELRYESDVVEASADANSPTFELASLLGDHGFSLDIDAWPTAADLHVLTDSSFRVSGVIAEPAGSDCLHHELLELVVPNDRAALRDAAERTASTGQSQRIVVHLACAPRQPMAVAIGAVESIATAGLVLSATAINSESVGHQSQQLSMLRSVLDLMDIAVFWKDRQGTFRGCNTKLLAMLGAETVADVVGKNDFDFFPKDEAEAYRLADHEVMDSGVEIVDLVETIRSADGKVENLHTSKMPVRNEDGDVVGMVGYFHVVTTFVRTEQALRTMEERYALVLDATQDGVWDFNLTTLELEVSARCAGLGGREPVAQTVEFEELKATLPDALLQQLIENSPNLTRQAEPSVAADIPIRLGDGSIRWLRVKGFALEENGHVTRVIGTASDVTQEIQRERDLLYAATHDDLTGLTNRRGLLETIDSLLEAGTTANLLYLDLDQFKLVNDTFGHSTGDELLRAVASRLTGLVRRGHTVARLGGDEFAIVVPGAGMADAEEVALRVLEAIAEPISLPDGTELYITVSIGLVHGSGTYSGALDFLRDGDTALYEAKAAGKSRIRTFNPAMRAEADRQLDLQIRIRRAVEHEEFVLHYQPILDSASGAVCGLEALIRWAPAGEELRLPGAFLPYLEQTALIIEVGDWVIRESLRQFAEWRDKLGSEGAPYLSLNLSRVQFQSPNLLGTIAESLEHRDIDPRNLVVEVTETAITDNFELMAETLERLRELGVRVAIDDFGVGQSSLSSLYKLPVDILKIDRAFVSRIVDGEPEPMVDAVLAIVRALGLRATAEGVETTAQRDFLRNAGCDYLQGYLLSWPLEPVAVAELLATEGSA